MEYCRDDAEKVFKHVYATLTAAIDFISNMKIENPEDAKGYASADQTLFDLHTSLEELWTDYEAMERDDRQLEEEDAKRAEGLATFQCAGGDPSKIREADFKEQIEEDKDTWEGINAEYKLPPGWPLDYPS